MSTKILIADDDPNLIRLLRLVLESNGYEVISASNGEQAVELTRKEHPDLLILDLMMPIMDGYRVLMQLYGEDPPINAPAIILTAQTINEYKDTATALGAVSFLEKPFDNNNLLNLIKETLRK